MDQPLERLRKYYAALKPEHFSRVFRNIFVFCVNSKLDYRPLTNFRNFFGRILNAWVLIFLNFEPMTVGVLLIRPIS